MRIFNRIPVPAGLAQATTRPFFNRAQGRRFEVHSEGQLTEVDLYDEIGFWGVNAADFRAMIRGAGDLRLRINSPGGDVFDGIAMYNDLLDHPGNVEVEITGLAASAASIVALAGDQIKIGANAFLMIHNAWTIGMGDRRDMAKYADVLGKVDTALAETYATKTGIDIGEIAKMMDDETWLSGSAAVDKGFADEVIGKPTNDNSEEEKAAARFDLSGYKNAPQSAPFALSGKLKAIEPTQRDVERSLRDAGFSRQKAKAMVAATFGQQTGERDASGDAEFNQAVREWTAQMEGVTA